MPDSDAARLRAIERPAVMESFEELQEFALDAARNAGLGEDELWKVRLAVEEVVVNVIRHAYAPGEPGAVRIACGCDAGGAFCVEISDQGAAFDPFTQATPDLTLSVEDRPLGGLGIFLVRQLMDEAVYRRCGDWNVVSLRLVPANLK